MCLPQEWVLGSTFIEDDLRRRPRTVVAILFLREEFGRRCLVVPSLGWGLLPSRRRPAHDISILRILLLQ